jgi:outer membrane murein-binding lipoprotein Lpp
MSGPLSSSPAAGAFSRRSLLLGAVTGAVVLVTGCTGDPVERADAVTPAQVDQLAAQVQVQEQLVAAYDQALATAPDLAGVATVLADQARAQLDRLRAAAPGDSPTSGAAASTSAAPDAAGAREWLRTQVTATADAHAAACPGFTGGRAALLGSIAAGLRGQAGQLA